MPDEQCYACRKKIESKAVEFTEPKGFKFHKACFKCRDCGADLLQNKPYYIDEDTHSVYCPQCLADLMVNRGTKDYQPLVKIVPAPPPQFERVIIVHAPKCHVCTKFVRKLILILQSIVLFQVCGKVLDGMPGNEFSMHEGRPYCINCLKEQNIQPDQM